jgi:hypothetical protein
MAVNYEHVQNQINNFNIWKIFADELNLKQVITQTV